MSVLAKVRKKRGYVLAYHRLLNEISPDLLAAYDEFYTQFTLVGRALTPVQKETVWVALIAATRAGPSGRIHLARARKAGMNRQAIADALALAAACEAWNVLEFSASAFPDWTNRPLLVKRYLRAFDAARGKTPPMLAHMAAAVVQAGRQCEGGMRLHLKRAIVHGARSRQLAEAMAFALLHCGGPTMVQATDAWSKMVKRGEVPRTF